MTMTPPRHLAAAVLLAASTASADDAPGLLLEYVGQVVNGGADPAASTQYGNLVFVACAADPRAAFTFFTEATTTRASASGPLRILRRKGTTTVRLVPAPADFTSPDAFRAGTPVQVSTLDQQVVVDTTTGAFTVVNVNTVTSAATGAWAGDCPLGHAGRAFRTVLTGHLGAQGGTPTGWFGGYAVAAR